MTIDASAISVAPSPTTDLPPTMPSPKVSLKRWTSALAIIGCLTIVSAVYVVHSFSGSDSPPVLPPKESGVHISATGLNAGIFDQWPKDEKPEFVLVISAEMNGYLQKCGCSDPQKGGLERRWNVIQWLKNEKGFEVLPLDLGDITTPIRQNPDPHVPTNQEQVLLKYVATMRALKVMGYKAIGVGLEEFALPLEKAVGAYSMQPNNDYPRLLAANITGYQEPGRQFLPRDVIFPNSAGNGSAIQNWEVYPVGGMNVGVTGVVGEAIVRHVLGQPIEDVNGKPVLDENKNPLQGLKIDASMRFAPDFGKAKLGKNSGVLVQDGLIEMSKLGKGKKPDLNVMLFQGPEDFARKVAGIFRAKPEHFDVIVCRTQESEPPGRADQNVMIGNKTLLVQVGHKGQQVGVVGVFKKKSGGFDLHYQRIVLTEEFDTPAGREKQNLALAELERYSKTVKALELLPKYPRRPHPLQLANSKVKYEYVGSDACQKCHLAEWNIQNGNKHGHAFEALVAAKKPSLREFDGECIVCHTVGFKYNAGYMDLKNAAPLNALLKNNGCENCHGPGNNHVLTAGQLPNAEAKKFAAEMSPWKFQGQDHLPTVKQLTEKAQLTAAESKILFRVDQICQQCHTTETDPHFQFEKYWPKIAHGNKQIPIPADKAVPVNRVVPPNANLAPFPLPKGDEKTPLLLPPKEKDSGPALEPPK